MLTKEILDSVKYYIPGHNDPNKTELPQSDMFDNHYQYFFRNLYYQSDKNSKLHGEKIPLDIKLHYKEYKPEVHTKEFNTKQILEKNNEISAYLPWIVRYIEQFREIAIKYFFPKSKVDDMPISRINIHYYESDENVKVGFDIYKTGNSFSYVNFCVEGNIENPAISVAYIKDYGTVCFAIDNTPFIDKNVTPSYITIKDNILDQSDIEKLFFYSQNDYTYAKFRYALNEEYTSGDNVVECRIILNDAKSETALQQFYRTNLEKINRDLRWIYTNTDIVKTDVKENVFKRTSKDKIVICAIHMNYERDELKKITVNCYQTSMSERYLQYFIHFENGHIHQVNMKYDTPKLQDETLMLAISNTHFNCTNDIVKITHNVMFNDVMNFW